MRPLRTRVQLWSLIAIAAAASAQESPSHADHEAMPVTEPGSDPTRHSGHEKKQSRKMDMGPMQGGRAPSDARDPNAYADGLTYTDMPGFEQSDRIRFGMIRADEFEGLSGNQGEGFAWSAQGNYGDDRNKAWFRTQGLKDSGPLDPTTDAELLWWHPVSAFWGSQLGLRQDFGAGSHTYLAAGIQGIAPYWFDVEATGYVAEDGRLTARVKGSYDTLLTNRLILTTSLETNLYTRRNDKRQLGSGIGNLEAGLRLRYEFTRQFAPYLGYVLERSFAGTADRRRAEGEPATEHRFVVGIRVWR
jgi:copper resistance protein B